MPTKTLDIEPPYIRDDAYGLALYEIYHLRFTGLWTLFKRGITGLCCDKEAPMVLQEVADIASGPVAVPQEGVDFEKGVLPTLSDQGALRCSIEFQGLNKDNKANDRLILRGMMSEILENPAEEEPGDLAVAICNTLAKNNYLPFPSYRKFSFSLLDLSMRFVGQDLMVEVAVTSHAKSSDSILPVPAKADGSLDLELIKKLSEKGRV